MTSSAGAIRAGRAFIEMYVDDALVQQSLENVKAKMKTFGAAVDAASTASFTRMSTSAVASTAATGASVGVLAATMGVLQASVYSVGLAFRAVFAYASTSVLKATAVIGGLSTIANKFFAKSAFTGLLNKFLSNNETSQAIGRWTRFLGQLSGSAAMKTLGTQIERIGLGAMITQGFQKGGIAGGIGASIVASIRSARSMITTAILSAVTSPFRAAGSILGSAVGAKASSGSSTAGVASSSALVGGLERSGRAGVTLVGSLGILRSLGGVIAGVATKVGGLATAISGPAILAARSFVHSAQEIIDKSKETGESIESLAAEKYGNAGLVSRKDIESAAELSSAFKELKQATAAAWAQIAAASLPILKSITENTILAAKAVGLFLSENRQLISTVVAVAVKVASGAAAVVALYGAFVAAIPIIGAILSPLGLVAAAIASIAYAFPMIRQEALAVFSFLFGRFASLGTILNETMQGMADAISGGSLRAAANVLWAGLKLAWLTGSSELREVYRNMVTSMMSFGIDLWASIQSGWAVTMQFFGDAWDVMISGLLAPWKTVQNALAGVFARIIAGFTGQKVEEVLAELTTMQDFDANKSQADRDARIRKREEDAKKRLEEIESSRKNNQNKNTEDDAARNADAKKQLEDAQREFEEAKKAAAKLRTKGGLAGGPNAFSPLRDTATLGTFSASAVDRQRIGGIKELQRMDQNLQIIADNSEKKGGLQWGGA